MSTARARLLLLAIALFAVGNFADLCRRYVREPNFQDYGYFAWQAMILDRFGSPWDPAARAAAEQAVHFPHTISVAHYFPSFFLLLIPLTRLPYAAGALLWLGLALAAMLFALVCLWRWFCRDRQPHAGAALILLLLWFYYPLRFNIGTGQNNLLTLGLMLLAMELVARRRSWLAGLPLALAALCKIIPLVLLAPLALRRDWRALGSTLVWFAVFNLLTLTVLPFSAFSDFSAAVAYKMQTDAHCILSFSVHALAWRLTGSKTVAGAVQNLVFLATVLAAAWLTWRRPALGWPQLTALWSLVMLIGSAFLGEAHLIFALPALVAAFVLIPESGAGMYRQAAVWLAAAALLGLQYYPDGLRLAFVWPLTALLNCKLYGLLLLAGLYFRQLAVPRPA